MKLLQLFKRQSINRIQPVKTMAAKIGTASVAARTEAVAMPSEPEAQRTHAEIMVIIGALMLAMLLSALDQTIVSTALPKIASDLHGLNKLSWVATAYLITSAIVTPIYGKLGDLYGRKKIFQISIVIFLVGSALCGLSQNMGELVFFRALQGIGGGGLMALVLAIIGDIVPPRQRGRYQGYFGAVFGLSSVGGPLLGGLLAGTTTLLGVAGWRWIFYINIPLGLLALAAIATRLHLPVHKQEHKIDYAGAALLSVSVLSIILVSVWAGVTYPWGSWQILSLIAAAVVLTTAFVFREKHASEPIIPMSLFKNDIFRTSSMLAFLAGIAMFATILYIPLYQQIVRGNSPTESGLLMLPLILGLLGASVVSGRLISKTGHYRFFPIFGTLAMALGMFLFSHLGLTTSHVLLSLWMFVIGAGLGSFMQVATLAVQNSTARENLGVATSTVTFFRSIGSALGGAIFGTILTERLAHHLAQTLPHGGAGAQVSGSLSGGAAAIKHLPAAIQHTVLSAYTSSFHDMFLIGIPFALAAFVVALFLREAPLRDEPIPSDISTDIQSHSPIEL